jgi:exodeoxyribonuclease-3
MRILSWNVNGLRAAERHGFRRWLSRCRADVVLLQEVKAEAEQLVRGLRSPRGWFTAFVPAQRRGYSGTALYARRAPDEPLGGLGIERFDAEGRIVGGRWGRRAVLGVYFPNGGHDCRRIPYKLEFYEALLAHLQALRRSGLEVVVAGDYNTAHREIDLARPRENRETSGFRPEEREALDRWLRSGFVDTFRALHPTATGRYSWWTYRAGARERNVGWRIDYHLVGEELRDRIVGASIHPTVVGSDHCPVGLELAD